MTCERCDGLMVGEWFCDLQETGDDICVEGYRCLLCGELVDAVILKNRGARWSISAPRIRRARVHHGSDEQMARDLVPMPFSSEARP